MCLVSLITISALLSGLAALLGGATILFTWLRRRRAYREQRAYDSLLSAFADVLA